MTGCSTRSGCGWVNRLGSIPVLVVLAGTLAIAQTESTAGNRSRMFFDRNCVTCHNSERPTAGLALDAEAVDPSRPDEHTEIWETVSYTHLTLPTKA